MKIKHLLLFVTYLTFGIHNSSAQKKTFDIGSFDKVIVSPHIEVIFEKADKQSVVIDDIDVSTDKFNVELKGKTLHIYLEDAKVYTKSEKVRTDDYKGRNAIYHGTLVSVRVYYTNLEEISLRGEETHKVESAIQGEELGLKIYGESEVYLKEIQVDEFNATIYGESYLEVKKGNALHQRIISYGESEINTIGVQNNTAKITAYGEGNVKLNVKEDLKVTAFGEASIHYKGSPMLHKGIVIGEATIHQIQ